MNDAFEAGMTALRAKMDAARAAHERDEALTAAYWADVVSEHIAQRWARVAEVEAAGDYALANRLTKDTLDYERMNNRASLR
jgi:hypothetical protein